MSDYPSQVWSVILINRETGGNTSSIVGTDFWVGYNANPLSNVRCNANPTSTGVYSCNGLVGNYLGIGQDISKYLCLSQIRAYSYVLNGHPNYDWIVHDPWLNSDAPDPLTFENMALLTYMTATVAP